MFSWFVFINNNMHAIGIAEIKQVMQSQSLLHSAQWTTLQDVKKRNGEGLVENVKVKTADLVLDVSFNVPESLNQFSKRQVAQNSSYMLSIRQLYPILSAKRKQARENLRKNKYSSLMTKRKDSKKNMLTYFHASGEKCRMKGVKESKLTIKLAIKLRTKYRLIKICN